jgi:hypothetical protein
MIQMIVLAFVVGFLGGAFLTVTAFFDSHRKMEERARRAVIKLNEESIERAELCKRLEYDRDQALESAANSMRKANELTAQVRRMSTR